MEYTLIEDSPLRCSYYAGKEMENDIRTRNNISRIERLLAGPLHLYQFGSHSQCKRIIVTKIDPTPYLENKEQVLLNTNEAWLSSNERKREHLLSLFNCDSNDVEYLRSRSLIFYTQPLYKDIMDFSMTDQITLYKKILAKYPPLDVVIKVHPRDNINYKKYFPEYCVFKKQIPSQLLNIIGVRYQRAITLFSSAVSTSNPEEVDWYGTEVDKRIFDVFGHKTAPNRARVCSI